MRDYKITDEGDSIEFALFQDEIQVGGGIFPLEFLDVDSAMNAAVKVGIAFVLEGDRNVTGNQLH